MGKKVTFSLPANVVGEATGAMLLGEFNNWDSSNGITLKKQKDGSMKVTTTLEGGRSYQYRYLLSDGRWVNDERADEYIRVSGLEVENCVISIPEEKPRKIAVKPAAEKVSRQPKTKKETKGKKKTP